MNAVKKAERQFLERDNKTACAGARGEVPNHAVSCFVKRSLSVDHIFVDLRSPILF